MFDITSNLVPKADQIPAIEKLVQNIKNNVKQQVLLGATGTGKTFTIANVVAQTKLKTLVLVHNKTLASQLYSEFKELFQNDNVEYYVSYFDFYQPEAYKPATDTYIEKKAISNQEIEMLRLSTINSLSSSKNTIVIASVAAIYASVSPIDFEDFKIVLKTNTDRNLKQLIYELVRLGYSRNENSNLEVGEFRNKGDVLEIALGHADTYTIRISFFGSEIEDIAKIDKLNNNILEHWNMVVITPANEYIMNRDRLDESIARIKGEKNERVEYFKKMGKLIEMQRIGERVDHDIEMLLELGYCNGIENYSRHLELRNKGDCPYTLFDFLNKDEWLLVVDESHITMPQIRGMYEGDKSRKEKLVEYGWRLPSALDNRPLKFDEFNSKLKNVIYVSATPSLYEKEQAEYNIIQQIVRPTGLLDPLVFIHKKENQMNDLLKELEVQREKNERTFITVLTINMAEELTKFLLEKKIKVTYLHNELHTIERTKILNDLRKGKYEALVGINLLKEGIDVPEVSLVAIFDADKPGLFRNETSLIQTFGRAARNKNGRIIMYADDITKDMKHAMEETTRRRNLQEEYNKVHNIIPQTIIKPIRNDLSISLKKDIKEAEAFFHSDGKKFKSVKERIKLIESLKKEMLKASKLKNFERAIELRDLIIELEGDGKIN